MAILAAFPALVAAGCIILGSAGAPVENPGDPLSRLLKTQRECPGNVFEFRKLLADSGAVFQTTLVGNRGFHNPGLGSFSLFEMIRGDLRQGFSVGESEFFFGHFTAAKNATELTPEQLPRQGALMIELIVWDHLKGFYNFYEMIGDGQRGRWFYRGDSRDVLADTALLHRQPDPAKPRFGRTLRCSGCHTSGGPIMKELAPPHGDWWEPVRGLPFGARHADAPLVEMLKTLVPADRLARAVNLGAMRLEMSPGFQTVRDSRSLQEQLRPLFCPTEINLQSDLTPLESPSGQITIPSGFLVDARLGGPSLKLLKTRYLDALAASGSQFPETSRADADHAWLTPVRAMADQRAIETLLKAGRIDRKFIADVLAVDFTNPLFSLPRCQLLRAVPLQPMPGWKQAFLENLRRMNLPASRELIANLLDPGRTPDFHQALAGRFLQACEGQLQTPNGVADLYRVLAQRRQEAFASEISKNPLGQILEPGFRVIFPQPKVPTFPGQFTLGDDCKVRLSAPFNSALRRNLTH